MFPSNPYESSNVSHLQFRREFVYLNALYYLIVQCKDALKQRLNDDIKKGGVAVGMVTHAISNKQFQGVFLHRTDAESMANDFDGFITLTSHQVFVSSHRMLINYLHNLLVHMKEHGLIKLSEKDAEKLSDYGLSSKKISEIFDSINISIASDGFEMQQLKRLAATRNVIEHNNGKVNSEYLTLTGYNLNIGGPVLANSKEVGEALAITEHIVQNVNIRAVKIWPQLLESK